MGRWYFCGLSSDGTALCRGVNESGQIGNGTTQTALSATAIEPGGYSVIDAGGSAVGEFAFEVHSCGIANGVALCWGANNFGQVGDGTSSSTPNRTRPTRVFGQP